MGETLSTTKAQRYVDARTRSVNGIPRRNRGRERLNSSGEWKGYRISCRSPEYGRVRHALPLRAVLLAAKAPLAPSARAESIGIARPTRPHSFPNERATIIQQGAVFQLHPYDARRAGHAVSLDSARAKQYLMCCLCESGLDRGENVCPARRAFRG